MEFKLIKSERKAPVLRHPSIPCLSRYYTINLLSGCPFRCKYCYTQSFSHHPGWDRIIFYHNSYDLLEKELAHKRKRPELITFSTACEPFTPIDEVLDQLYDIITLIFEYKIPISITTKSVIPARFVKLFSENRDKVSVQVSLAHCNDVKRKLVEPNTPSVVDRLDMIRKLVENDILVSVRVDPLIPLFSDTEADIDSLFRKIKSTGAKNISCSYLFLREANIKELAHIRYGKFSFGKMIAEIYTNQRESFCSRDRFVYIPRLEYRTERYNLIKSLAELYELNCKLCRCKEPDITSEVCSFFHSNSSSLPSFTQLKMKFHQMF